LVAAGKFLVAATKILFVVPYFVAVTKLFFSVWFSETLTASNLECVVAENCDFVYLRIPPCGENFFIA